MRNLILASAAALAISTPAFAQDTDESDTAAEATAEAGAYTMTSPQQTMYDAWPADRQTSYDAWPMGVQEYYWTLTPDQQKGWWVLTDEQRVRVYEMTPQQRTAAWQQISAQLNNAGAASAQASTTASTSASAMPSGSASATTSGNIEFRRSEHVQQINDTPATGEVPICKKGQQDNCINSWEARKTGTRPLDHWPGKPASEMNDDDEGQ